MNPDPSARAREIAVLIATTSIDATYADCDAGGVNPELEDDEWHALIGYRVIAALESAGIRLIDDETLRERIMPAIDMWWASGDVSHITDMVIAALHQRVRADEGGG